MMIRLNSTTIILVLYTLVSVSGTSQNLKLKTADKFFNQLAYIQAVEYYKDLVVKKQLNVDVLRKTAYCEYQLANYNSAQVYYKQMLNQFENKISETDLLNYIQVLKYTKDYTETKKILDLLRQKNSNHLVVKSHYNNPDYITKVKSDSSNYTITNIKGINTESSEMCPIFFKNNGMIIFASNRKNSSLNNKIFAWDNTYFLDLWQAKKQDSCQFNELTGLEKKISSIYHDGPVVLSNDGKTMYLTRSNFIDKKIGKSKTRLVNLKLFILKFDSLKEKWCEPISFAYNSDEYSVGHPAISKDGTLLYFISDMPGGFGQTDIYVSELKNGIWQKPENLGQSINTEGREMFPYVHEDGTLFFSSDGRAGLGGLDLYFSAINLDEYFEPQNLGYPLNTNMDDFGFYLEDNLVSGYFASNRSGGFGKDDIYFFNSKKPIIGSKLNGIVYDEITHDPVSNAIIYLSNGGNKNLEMCKTDVRGRYSFTILNPSLNKYKFSIQERGKYYDKTMELDKITTGNNIKDIYISPKYELICTVIDAETKKPIEDVKVSLIKKENSEIKTYKTDINGEFNDLVKNKKIGNIVSYTIKFEKKGYVNTVQDYEITLDTNTILNLNEKLNCVMQKMEIGNDLSKSIQINPIYFDLAKWDIKPVSAKELDKIVNLMKENPTMKIELGSHTDCRNNKAANMKLSDMRAKSSAAYIISKGIESKRIVGKGYGETKLINHCECEGVIVVPCSEDEHQANRRTEFIITNF